MAGQPIIEFIAEFLIDIFPSAEAWGLVLIGITVAYFIMRRVPLSASVHLGMILVLGVATLIGGVFEALRILLYAFSGGLFFLGLWNFIGKR